MIYPDDFRLFKIIEDKKCYTKIYLYYKSECLFSGKIQNITPERFNRLKSCLEELIKINNSEKSLIFGIVEVQNLIEKLK